MRNQVIVLKEKLKLICIIQSTCLFVWCARVCLLCFFMSATNAFSQIMQGTRNTIMFKSVITRNRIDVRILRNSIALKSSVGIQNDEIVPKIGLEIHAQLDINSKLFSQGGNVYQAASNSQVDLLDVALPGTLPKLNSRALELAIISSLGLKCTVQESIHFDRKNYFYADMPAGYQITQYNKPIAKEGYVDFVVNYYRKLDVVSSPYKSKLVSSLWLEEEKSRTTFEPYKKRSCIKQIQLEQDSAKTLTHIDEESQQSICDLVDYNRSGASLIEIVFEPDLTSQHEASSLVRELISVLQSLGTCRCELQEGTLRVDANVSISSLRGQEIKSAKVELKNLNSLKALNGGIRYEIERQAKIIESGEHVTSETRTYDTKLNITLPLRAKEETVDYRFVPDPNLPSLKLDDVYIRNISQKLSSRLTANIQKKKNTDCVAEEKLTFEIEDPDEIEMLCLDLIKKMKSTSKKYVRDGHNRHMFRMLDKLSEITNDKVDIYAAMKILDRLLRKPHSDEVK